MLRTAVHPLLVFSKYVVEFRRFDFGLGASDSTSPPNSPKCYTSQQSGSMFEPGRSARRSFHSQQGVRVTLFAVSGEKNDWSMDPIARRCCVDDTLLILPPLSYDQGLQGLGPWLP